MKVTVISPFHIEVEQSETEWLHEQLQSDMHRAAVRGVWKEEGDTYGITWNHYRSIIDAQLSIGSTPWKME